MHWLDWCEWVIVELFDQRTYTVCLFKKCLWDQENINISMLNLSAWLHGLHHVLKWDIKLISFYWPQTGKPSDQNLISALKLKSGGGYENGCRSYASLIFKECSEEVEDCSLSLSLSLHPTQRSNTSSASESSGAISSSSRGNFGECSGYSEGPRINLELSMSLSGS